MATRHKQRRRLMAGQIWPYVRLGLRLIGLSFEQHKGLHLAVQALVAAGDLAVKALTRSR